MVAQIEALAEQQPDIIALQEVRIKNAAFYRQVLASKGFPYSFDSFQLALTPPRHLDYGVLVACRYPLRVLEMKKKLLLPERVIAVSAMLPKTELVIYNVYVPTGGRNWEGKMQILESLYEELSISSDLPRILCGDFNTPQVETVQGQLITFGQRRRQNGEFANSNIRQDKAERDILVGLAEVGLADVYRYLNGYTAQEFSWYYRARGLERGFRLDHILASLSLSPYSCSYLHKFREAGLSDHSPIEAAFDF